MEDIIKQDKYGLNHKNSYKVAQYLDDHKNFVFLFIKLIDSTFYTR
jgi:hypothetical protein